MPFDCLYANTLLFLHVPSVSDPSDTQNWQLMAAIKSNILRRMDSAAPGVRICCIKFLQQVVLVQTPGAADPRVNTPHRAPQHMYGKSHVSQRVDHNDISLSLVPRDHPLIPYASLEAEGHGLLDRLLDIIHGDHRLDRQSQAAETHLTGTSDGLLVTATLNSLGMLIHRRPNAANKILNSVFNFNPLKLANSPMTPKNKVIIKSIERTTRALLVNIMKRYDGISYMSLFRVLTVAGTPRTQSMGAYSNSSSACTVRALKSLMNLIVKDQHPVNRLMALIKPRGSASLLSLQVAHPLFNPCRLVK